MNLADGMNVSVCHICMRRVVATQWKHAVMSAMAQKASVHLAEAVGAGKRGSKDIVD